MRQIRALSHAQYRTGVVLSSVLLVFIAVYTATAFADDLIADPRTGCKIWNSKPLSRYSIEWTGDCKDGLAEGMGSVQWYANGRPSGRYDGEYKAGKMQGLGSYAMPYGSRHTGHYHLNKRHGQGTYLWDDGTRYEGQFVDNKMQGQGLTTWTDGSSHTGEYLNNKKNGFGAMRLAKGNPHITYYASQGQWQDGFLTLTGMFLEDNLVMACASKAECMSRMRNAHIVLNEAEHADALKEVFDEIPDAGE